MGIVCRTSITFPRTTDSVIRLGAVVCAVDAPAPGGAAPRVRSPVPKMQLASSESPAGSPEKKPGSWGVQVAAYKQRAKADSDAARLAERIGTTGMTLQVDLGGKGVWYRVVLGLFSTAEEASLFRGKIDSRIPGGAGAVLAVDRDASKPS